MKSLQRGILGCMYIALGLESIRFRGVLKITLKVHKDYAGVPQLGYNKRGFYR